MSQCHRRAVIVYQSERVQYNSRRVFIIISLIYYYIYIIYIHTHVYLSMYKRGFPRLLNRSRLEQRACAIYTRASGDRTLINFVSVISKINLIKTSVYNVTNILYNAAQTFVTDPQRVPIYILCMYHYIVYIYSMGR